MVTPPTQTRPTSVTVISWVWIAMGILMVLSGAMGLFSFSMMQEISQAEPFPPARPEDLPAGFRPMMIIFNNFHILAGVQIILALVAITAGINLLKLRRWARTAIETLTWFSLTYIVVFGCYWVYMWLAMTSSFPDNQMPAGMGFLKYFGVIMGVVINIIFGTPLVIMLNKLRSTAVKNIVC